MQWMFIDGGPTTGDEWQAGVKYCEEDVQGTLLVFRGLLPKLDLPRALIRGRYVCSVAVMERNGMPIDTELLDQMRDRWDDTQTKLIAATGNGLGVYEGGKFRTHLFRKLLSREQIPWPKLETGKLDLRDKTFRNMARGNRTISMLRELRHALGQTRLFKKLAVGSDGRNRTGLAPFRSKTGRNQLSNAKFVFGAARAIRGLVQPPPEKVFAYADYTQEIAVTAILSKDDRLRQAYGQPCCYVVFGQQAGAIPAGATKDSHPAERALFKGTMLGVGYSMGAESQGQRIGKSTAEAEALLDLHRILYSNYWRWVERAIIRVMAGDELTTVLGWQYRVGKGIPYHEINVRSIGNWITHAKAAEMLRCACILLTEAGIEVACPVHDAVGVLLDVDDVVAQAAQVVALMKRASGMVLGGYECKVSMELVPPGEHDSDKDGAEFWAKLLELAGPIPSRI